MPPAYTFTEAANHNTQLRHRASIAPSPRANLSCGQAAAGSPRCTSLHPPLRRRSYDDAGAFSSASGVPCAADHTRRLLSCLSPPVPPVSCASSQQRRCTSPCLTQVPAGYSVAFPPLPLPSLHAGPRPRCRRSPDWENNSSNTTHTTHYSTNTSCRQTTNIKHSKVEKLLLWCSCDNSSTSTHTDAFQRR